MTLYRDRPVWTLEPDWDAAVSQTVGYDLRRMDIGWAASVGEAQQERLALRLDFRCDLANGCEIATVEAFFQTTLGRQMGWWLPAPVMLGVVEGASGASVLLQAGSWGSVAAAFVGLDVWLEDDYGRTAARRITAAVQDDGALLLTLSSAVDWLSADVALRRLLYVRLDGDGVVFDLDGESSGAVALRVVELPLEYQDAELGERPAYLYALREGDTIWRFTSHDVDVTHEELVYTSAPFGHGDWTESMTADRDDVLLESWMFEGNPLLKYVPFPPERELRLVIVEKMLGTDVSATLFEGTVMSVELKGRAIRATAGTRMSRLQVKVPRFFLQRVCNYRLFGASCKVVRGAYEIAGTLSLIGGSTIRMTSDDLTGLAADWFAYGEVEVMRTDGGKERRAVRSSSVVSATVHELKLYSPLSTVEVDAAMKAWPGCDGRPGTCDAKFDNFPNFGGHPFMPKSNLVLNGVEQKAAPSGGKK